MKQTTLSGASADIFSQNIARLRELFPEVFCEERIDFDKLRAVLGDAVDENEERYNFTWWGKSRALRLAQTPSMGTLRPCKEESKDWDTTGNLYIEGDNLEVLKLLQKSYHNRVKLIYIDPPYNTGNDFVYKDDYADPLQGYLRMTGQIDAEGRKLFTNSEASGRYHTNWLNMLYPRLRLARNLLREDGFIFISIDINEICNLRKICDEIFGEENFRNEVIIRRGQKSVQAQFPTWDKLGSGYERVIIYSKNSEYRFPKILRLLEETKLGRWNNHWRGTDRPTMRYELFGILPEKGQWRWERERSLKAIENYNRLLSELNLSDSKITQEQIDNYYLKKLDEGEDLDFLRLSSNKKPEHFIPPSGSTLLNDNWFDIPISSSKEILPLFKGKKIFDNPKHTVLLKRIMEFGGKEDIILDFFSGSATTAHAVIQLNAEDGGQRKFILVQLPEPTPADSEACKAGYADICEIGKERIRRAGEKIKAELKEKQKGQPSLLAGERSVNPDDLDIGFKVFKLDASNLKKWNPETADLKASLLDAVDNLLPGRTELDLVYEILLKYGADLSLPIEEYACAGKKVYAAGGGALLLCLAAGITAETVQEIVSLKQKLNPETVRVVFRDGGFPDDSAKTNASEILRNAGVDEVVSI